MATTKQLDRDYTKKRAELDRRREELTAQARETAEQLERAQAEKQVDLDRRREALEALLRDRVEGFGFIASAWADYERALAEGDSAYLLGKERPAQRAAYVVREKGLALAEARRRAKLAEWVVALYEFHFPWLTELRDFEEEQSFVAVAADDETGDEERRPDPAARWLSPDEWKALPTVERNQLALDRWLRSRKTAWQVGRDYERYIGYLREAAGCQVSYQGIFKGLEDLGRDLLAEKDGTIEVIQCKRWSQSKVIHEKHLFQLFGTMVACRIENPSKTVTGTFTTTTSLSERARQFAEVLGIRVEETFPLEDYPRIKCNVSRVNGESIYHLPFDQQYDATVVESDRGECYVQTVAEAEALGFRRAFRWMVGDE